MTKKEIIIELLENMTSRDLVCVHREYTVNEKQDFDSEIFTLDDLDMIAEGRDAYWLLCRAYYGEFEPTIEYFTFNGYGNLQSIRDCELLEYIDVKGIADYCIENNKDLYNDEIREILDSEYNG